MKEDFYISLLYKKLSSSLEASEEKQLIDWLQESQENRILADSVELAWNESGTLAASPEVNLSEAFAELEAKISADEEKPINHAAPGKIRSFQRNWMKIAAALTFLLAAALLLGDYFQAEKVEWVELKTRDEIQLIKLADNSVVKVNKNSRLSYPKTFSDDSRIVKLDGEAFFEVEPDAARPFIIEAPQETIEVLGTSFRVKAYKKDPKSLVQVATGKVAFSPKNSSARLILTKNQMGVLEKSTKSVQKIEYADPNDMAWGTNTLTFKDTKMHLVLAQLEDYFQVEFVVEDSQILTCGFTQTFPLVDEQLENILTTISTTYGTVFEKTSKNSYQVRGGSCKI